MNFIVIIILIICCMSSSICAGLYFSGYLPSSFQFNKQSDNKYIGHVFQQLSNTTESDCLTKCLSNPFCIGTTYDSKKSLCSLQWQNKNTMPSFSTQWSGINSYSIINPQRAVTVNSGNKSSGNVYKTKTASSLNDCINQCIGNDPDCKSANFNSSTSNCDFIGSNTDMGDKLTADSNYTYIMRNGLVGGMCQSNMDCIFGLCKNNVCLNASPLQSGSECNLDSECASGKCQSEAISFAEQDSQRQGMVSSGDPTAVTCDTYKTCGDCQEKLVSGVQGQDSAVYSGAKCEWRYSTQLSDDILNKSCKARQSLIPAGVISKCFPKTISTTRSTCK